MSEPGGRRPNELLRYHRKLRGWTLEDVADNLHRLATGGGREPGVDAHMISRWERGVRRPAPRYVALLSQLFNLPADHLGLVDRVTPSHTKEDDVRRRQFLQYLAVVSGATMLDWDRLNALADGTCPADEGLLADLRALTTSYARQVDTMPPRGLLPAVRSHLAILSGSLNASQPAAVRRRLQSLAAETAALAGRLSHLLENRGDEHACWAYARDLAREARDGDVLALTLAMERSQYSSVTYGGMHRDDARALALLEEAASHLAPSSSPYLRAFVLASRAESHAAVGHATASGRDLDEAERGIEAAAARHDGYFMGWDTARIAGYRGSCALALRQPEDASTVLESALARTSGALPGQRSAVLTDLAAAYAQQREYEHASALLMESVAIAERADLAELVQRVVGARRHLRPWASAPAVRQLDERLLSVT